MFIGIGKGKIMPNIYNEFDTRLREEKKLNIFDGYNVRFFIR